MEKEQCGEISLESCPTQYHVAGDHRGLSQRTSCTGKTNPLQPCCCSFPTVMNALKAISAPRLEAKHEASHSRRMPTAKSAFIWGHCPCPEPHQGVWHSDTYFSFISRHQISNSMESPYREHMRNIFQLLKITWIVIIQSQEILETTNETEKKKQQLF